ncbi:MAG TPA: hypothetical protein VMI11_02170 [Actinomycetes bacterium]|nr:hypothetical protein [Actinomycetes bacterium]
MNDPQTSEPRVVYRATDNHVHWVAIPEVDGAPSSTVDTDVTAVAHGVDAVGNPTGYVRFDLT